MFPGNSTANFSPEPGITSASSPARRRVFSSFSNSGKNLLLCCFSSLKKYDSVPSPLSGTALCEDRTPFQEKQHIDKGCRSTPLEGKFIYRPVWRTKPPLLDFNKKSLNLTSKSLKNPVSGDIFIARYHIINYRKISCRIVKTPSMNI